MGGDACAVRRALARLLRRRRKGRRHEGDLVDAEDARRAGGADAQVAQQLALQDALGWHLRRRRRAGDNRVRRAHLRAKGNGAKHAPGDGRGGGGGGGERDGHALQGAQEAQLADGQVISPRSGACHFPREQR